VADDWIVIPDSALPAGMTAAQVAVPETADPPVPFPDHDVAEVATVLMALAMLAQGDPDLRGPALDALTPDVVFVGEHGTRVDTHWMEVIADTLAWTLGQFGVTPDDLAAASFALSNQMTGPAEAPAGEGK
jgi:hypothetical protein